jgi:hypothetical protein
MLTAWMRDNESNKWLVGIKFVQLQKNSALNKGIGRTPYEDSKNVNQVEGNFRSFL